MAHDTSLPASSEMSFLASIQGSFEERDKGLAAAAPVGQCERPRDCVANGESRLATHAGRGLTGRGETVEWHPMADLEVRMLVSESVLCPFV